MEQITVVIPTRGRLEKLHRTLASLPLGEHWFSVIIVCDGDKDTFDALCTDPRWLSVMLVPERRGAVFCRNHAMHAILDGVLYATDDILFPRGVVKAAMDEFNEAFPDDDGVLGFQQDFSHHKAGVGLVGLPFLRRYPDRQLFCPEYDHFACQEIAWLAESLDRFCYSDGRAKITHLSPFKDRAWLDQTHQDARRHKIQDMDTLHRRQAAGLIWGAQ